MSRVGRVLNLLLLGAVLLGLPGCGDGEDAPAQQPAVDRSELLKQRAEIDRQRQKVEHDLALFDVALDQQHDKLAQARQQRDELLARRQALDALDQRLEQERAALGQINQRVRELDQQYKGLVLPRVARREMIGLGSDRREKQALIASLEADRSAAEQAAAGLDTAQRACASAEQSLADLQQAQSRLSEARSLLIGELRRLDALLAETDE